MTKAKVAPGIWVGQLGHFSSLAALLALVWMAWQQIAEPFPAAFWTAVALPVIHQLFVWLAWRLELRSSRISNSIGFRGYLWVFFLLFGGRFLSQLVLAWLDSGSLDLPVLPRTMVATSLALPGIYTMYSVRRYFGMIGRLEPIISIGDIGTYPWSGRVSSDSHPTRCIFAASFCFGL